MLARVESQAIANRDSEPKFYRALDRYLACGEQQTASTLRLLKRAVEENYCMVEPLDHIPALAPLRSNPEFQQIRAHAQRCHDAFEAHRAQVDRGGATLPHSPGAIH